METCCHHHDDDNHHDSRKELQDYDIHGDDPTLSACCLKDMKEQKEYVRIQTILQRHDVAQKRLAERHLAPSSLPPTITPSTAMALSDDEEEEDEFDYLLDEVTIDTQRRNALEAKMALKKQGLGIVWGDDEFMAYQKRLKAQAWKELHDAKQDRPTVIACRPVDLDEGRPTTSILNLALLTCAEKYLGTCIYAISPACASQLQDLCHKALHGPVLVALNAQGHFIANYSLVNVDEESWDGRIMPWLHRCNVLEEDYISTTTSTTPSDDANEEDSGYDCGVDKCRLRNGYYHEHIGSSAQTKQEISAWRR